VGGLIKRQAVTAAVVCLLVAAALWIFYPGVPARWVFLGLGVFFLLLSLVLNAREARTAIGTRTVRYGTGAALMAVLALGVVVAANAISVRHNTRWDLTENKRNSVSPQTIQVLRTLKTPVSAIAFYRSDTPGKKTAEDLLAQYATYSGGKFTWRLEDTDRAPALARQYGVESYGTVVLEGGPPAQIRTEKVLDADEEKLTNGIVKVTRAGKRIVYVVKGQGEREIGATDRNGFSQAKEQMEKANYEVKELFLARDPKIPDDGSIVIIPGPRTDFFPQELAALDAYVAALPEADAVARQLEGCGLTGVDIEVAHWELVFRSAREFFYAPVIEHGPLSQWKEIVGREVLHETFLAIKDAIDTYFAGRAFAVSVFGGRFSARKST